MSGTGIAFPSVVDLVTEGSESVHLVLVETRQLEESDAPALQEKLNNYLSYALDGGLASQFPSAEGKHTVIRIDLYAQPDVSIHEFVRKYSGALVEYGVSLEVNINGQPVT